MVPIALGLAIPDCHARVKRFSAVSTEGRAGPGRNCKPAQVLMGKPRAVAPGLPPNEAKNQIILVSKTVPAKSAAAIAYPYANVAKLLVRPDKRRTRVATASAATLSPKRQLQTTS